MSNKKMPFSGAEILLPKEGFDKWSVVACDQFTSEPDYWKEVEKTVGKAPSALRITLPEYFLSKDNGKRIADINENMNLYIKSNVFNTFPDSMIYVERQMKNGKIRHGIVGAIDLEAYDYNKGSSSLIRATEGTVLERIPPRVEIRKDAPIELPHVMLLIDDKAGTVIEPLKGKTPDVAYDTELMLGGGHIRGSFIPRDEQNRITAALTALMENGNEEHPLLFAVGDGNHSLATAKSCYELTKNPLARYALCEIVNIHDEALEFEPIYRVLFNADPADILAKFKAYYKNADGSKTHSFEYITKDGKGTVEIKGSHSGLPVGTLQVFLDDYLKKNPSVKIDYIHGTDVTRKLASEAGAIGFIFDGMGKDELFPTVKSDGALPRKTFSMGEAAEKRYYMECRKIK